MKFKECVELSKNGVAVQKVCVEAMINIAKLYDDLGIAGSRAVITSVMDGKHMPGSLHYEGLAFDLRTWSHETGAQMSKDEKGALARHIIDTLGPDWDIVVEATHIHCEYDPK